jgi:signal transduction histidine kinase
MLPSSHCKPMWPIDEVPAIAKEQLVDAFSAFMGAASRLEHSHLRLHNEVEQLRRELAERNAALAVSRAENERLAIALRQILDGLPCGVAVVEVATEKLVLANPACRALLDLGTEFSYDAQLPDWVRAAIVAVDNSPAADGFEQEVEIEREGKIRWLAIRSSQLEKAASQQVVLIIRDVTGQKNTEQEREAARNLIALAEMTTVLAHEVRNPLGSMELLIKCLADDAGISTDSQQYIEHLQAGIRSLSATVNNALRFHNPGSQAMRPVEIASVLKSSVEFVRPLAKQRGIALKVEESLPQTEVMADAEALKQVFFNLFSNAVRHTAPAGQISVISHLAEHAGQRNVVIEFADTGSGIKREDLAHIFEAGFTTTASSGLGLAVCSRIVTEHRGSITVNSKVGEGTVFLLEFPAL